MSAHTQDFGLSYFGPGVPGSITDEGGKFTLGDRLTISRLLAGLARHDHQGGDRLADPSGSPALALDTVSGQLPGGLNVYYRISYVDAYDLETAASAEAVVSTPALLTAPSFPILSAMSLPDGATGLGAGDYTYALTAIAGPQQTPLGIAATLTLDGVLPTVVVTFPDAGQDGQDQWGVWRKGPGEDYYTFLDAVAVDATSYIDDGSVLTDEDAADPSHQPPTTNVTSSTNAITVVVPDPTEVSANASLVRSWRLYRTFASGAYATSSLLAEVSTTVNADGTGGLVTEFVDDGSLPLQPGQPSDVSQTLTPSVRIQGGGGAATLVVDSTGASWRVVAAMDGSLVTRASATLPHATDGATVLLSPAQVAWRLDIDTEGALITTAASPGPGDISYPSGFGPILPSPDPTIEWQLGVADDGALTTTLI